ncbi:ankyrin repeat and SOCS box protein 12 [Biomphalaria glabrata]|nr:ankyrin repeat and SOCS box protein 12 [Biomphalaria glabrata]
MIKAEMLSHSESPASKEVSQMVANQFKNCLPHSKGESQLHVLAFQGESDKLKQLLILIRAEPNRLNAINQRNRLGCTPLRLAATSGHLDCLNLLLEAGASVDISDVKCQTPLFVAIKNRRYECAEKLLQAGACPEGDSSNSSTPLYVAFMNRDLRCLLLLLEYGAHPDQLTHSVQFLPTKYTPKITSLRAAVDYLNGPEDTYKAVRALLIRGCNTDNFTYHSIIYQDNERLVDLLYNFGLDSTTRDVNNRLASELDLNNQAKRKLCLLRATPRSLLSACRVAIISCLAKPRRNLCVLDCLPLPASMVSYLKFNDV